MDWKSLLTTEHGTSDVKGFKKYKKGTSMHILTISLFLHQLVYYLAYIYLCIIKYAR